MPKNIAYIDGTNLHKGIKSLDEELDYARFRVWLYEKYQITEAHIFMGYIAEQKDLYQYLEKSGFKLTFKESIIQRGKVKGNADSELVLKSVRDVFEQDINAVILISGDGDFACLVDFLLEKEVFKTLLVPNIKFCSYLLKKKKISITRLDHPRLLKFFTKKRTLARD